MSLKWRIALGLAIIAAFVGAIGATGAYLTVSNQLDNSIDESLLGRAASFDNNAPFQGRPPNGGTAALIPDGLRNQAICPPPGAVQPAAAAQLVEADGTVTACIVGAVHLPVDAADRAIARGSSDTRLRTVSVNGTSYRVLTVPWRGASALQSARSLAENESVLDSLRLQLLAVSLAGYRRRGRARLGVRPPTRPPDRAPA